MKAIKNVIFFLLVTATSTLPFGVNAQNDSSAYTESGEAAHWSAYVPIVGLVGAAIFFGIADESCSKTSSYSFKSSSKSSPYCSYTHCSCSHM